jgi:hypothetical protein
VTPENKKAFTALAQQRAEFLRRLAGWSEERLKFRPKPSMWSALDVADHLVRVERTAVSMVLSNLPDGQPVRWTSRIRGAVANAAMKSRIRVPVPRGVETVIPEGAVSLGAITADWDRTRAEMEQMVAELSQHQLQRGLLRHPVAGWMTILQGLTFLSAHLQHHGYQLDRLEKVAPR